MDNEAKRKITTVDQCNFFGREILCDVHCTWAPSFELCSIKCLYVYLLKLCVLSIIWLISFRLGCLLLPFTSLCDVYIGIWMYVYLRVFHLNAVSTVNDINLDAETACCWYIHWLFFSYCNPFWISSVQYVFLYAYMCEFVIYS